MLASSRSFVGWQQPFRRDSQAMVLGMGTAGLGVMRALGEQGIRVSGLGWQPRTPAAASRYCVRALICPHPGREPQRVVDTLLAEAQRLDAPAVLLPTSDEGLLFLARNADTLRGAYLFTLQESRLQAALVDKRLQYELAKQVDTPYPQTFYPYGGDDLERVAREVRYPALLKPALSHVWAQMHGSKAIQVDGPEELEYRYAELARDEVEVMVQSLVVGPVTNEYVLDAYLDASGQVLGRFTRRKIRQFPPDFGVGTLLESVRCEEVERLGLELLQRLGYHGLACVQFKRDDRDGRLSMLEINGRLAFNSFHATRCGVNLPLLAYLDLTGQHPRPIARYRLGVRYLDLATDTLAFLALHESGELGLLEWLHSIASARAFTHFDLRDPLPFLRARRNELPRARKLARDLWRKSRTRHVRPGA
jgi:D-aspartate ligase